MAGVTRTESGVEGEKPHALWQRSRKTSQTAVLNAMEEVRSNPIAKQVENGILLYVQLACPAEEVSVWTETDYLMHVVSGSTSFTVAGEILAVNAGEAVFVRKGAYFIPAHSNGDPCVQLYFIPDHFVRETISGLSVDISA